MDDKIISSPDMTEYKFAESDGVSSAGTITEAAEPVGEAPASDQALSKFGLKNINLQKIRLPILIAAAISTIYGIFSFYNTKKTQIAEQKKMQTQEVITQQALPIRETVVQSLPPPSPTLSSDQVEQVQAAVQQKIDAATQEIANNRNQLLGLKEAISKTQEDISSVGQNVGQLTATTQQLLLEVQQLKAPPKIKPKKKAAKPLAVYHIRAIVPGRVWIESADGRDVTLRVGDSLEGYGTVEVISPQQGMVLMSNGSYIQYGINDF